MTWGKFGQEWPDLPETEGLSTEGIAMYAVGVCDGNRLANNGYFSGRSLSLLIARANIRPGSPEEKRGLKSLVSSGSWHSPTTAHECDSPYCELSVEVLGPPVRGGFMFHEWAKDQPTADEQILPVLALRRQRDSDLKHNRQLCTQIQIRDQDLCRYCGCEVNWKDKRGETGATYDHVNPWETEQPGPKKYGNTLANVVVACRKDNGRKKDRTPEQAGMILWPPGTTAAEIATQTRLGRDLVATESGPGPDLASRTHITRDGPDRYPTESRPGRDQVSNGHSSNGNGTHR